MDLTDKEQEAIKELKGSTPGSDTIVNPGHAVKALGDGRVGGYLVRFTNPDEPDLEGDYFDASTDFVFNFPGKSAAWFSHALYAQKTKLSSDAELKEDEFGIWAETVLDERDQYEAFIYEQVEQGKMGWSSGTASHLVETERMEKSNHITRWPLGLDASLTHMPAEPRNTVIPLKQLSEILPPFPEQEKPDEQPAGNDHPAGGNDHPTASEEEPAMKAQPIINEQHEEVSEMDEKEVIKTIELTEDELTGIVADAASTAAAKALKELPAKKEPQIQVTKDDSEQPFKNAGEFFRAVANAAGGQKDRRLLPLQSEDGYAVREYKATPTGANEDVPSEGGFLVGEDQAPGLIERMYADGEVLNRISWANVGPNSNGLVMNGVDETSRADGSRWGGVRGYWVAEGASITASQPSFRQIALRLHKAAALCYATDELLADASALESWLMTVAPAELRFKVEDAIINGNGVGKPAGVLNDSGIYVEISAETGQAATTLVYENVLKMWAQMWAPSRNNAVWYINQDVEPQLNTMSLAVGTAGVPVYLPAGGASGQQYGTLFGRPVIPIEYCATLGTAGDVILADMSQYQGIRKGGIQSASSIHVNFTSAETVFRFIYRVDGQPLWNSYLTPKSGSSNYLSPFLAVATRS